MNNGKSSSYFSQRGRSCQAGTDVTVMVTFLLLNKEPSKLWVTSFLLHLFLRRRTWNYLSLSAAEAEGAQLLLRVIFN